MLMTTDKNEKTFKQIIVNANGWYRDNLMLETMADDLLDKVASYVDELDEGNFVWG